MINKEVNMVGTKEEVEDMLSESVEVVESINLPPIMTDDSMGSVDDIVVFSYVKVAEAVVGSNRSEVKKELNMWVDTKEEVDKIWS